MNVGEMSFLNRNEQFARNHTLAIRPAGAVYTFIPKNACSTLQYSVAIANGRSIERSAPPKASKSVEGLYANAEEIRNAKYAFVVLRCPYRRAASAFLDKIVSEKSRGRDILTSSPMRKLLVRLGIKDNRLIDDTVLSLTFSGFLSILRDRDSGRIDHHFRPQGDFLLSRSYDDFFCVEAMETMAATLRQKIAFDIADHSWHMKHHITKLNRSNVTASELTVAELLELKRKGVAPSYDALYSEPARRLVGEVYSRDIDLYARKLGAESLLFPA
jgi:hypothetical protein